MDWKNIVILSGAVVFLLALGIVWPMVNAKDCRDDLACFQQASENCQKATFSEKPADGGQIRLDIKGLNDQGWCVTGMTIASIPADANELMSWAGKSLECRFTLNEMRAGSGQINPESCSGPLLDEMAKSPGALPQ